MSSVNRIIIIGNLGREPKSDQFESFDIVEKIIHERMNGSHGVEAPNVAVLSFSSIPKVDAMFTATPISVGSWCRSKNKSISHNLPCPYRLRLRRLSRKELRAYRYIIDPFDGPGGLSVGVQLT